MHSLTITVESELPGWRFLLAQLRMVGNSKEEQTVLCRRVTEWARGRYTLDALSSLPAVAALRRLFKAAGCDPSRYRPASEALLRRILKGEDLPVIHPLVDFNNCLSVELAVPCCVMAEGTFTFPLQFRAGQPGENYLSLKGSLQLEGKPLLLDQQGPLDTPITGSQRVMVRESTASAWLIAYIPEEVYEPQDAMQILLRLAQENPNVATLQHTWV